MRKHSLKDLIMFFLIWSLHEFKTTLHLLDTFHLLSGVHENRPSQAHEQLHSQAEPVRNVSHYGLHLKKYDCQDCFEPVLATDFLCGLTQIIKPIGASGIRVCESQSKMLFQTEINSPSLSTTWSHHCNAHCSHGACLLTCWPPSSLWTDTMSTEHEGLSWCCALPALCRCTCVGVSSSMDKAHSPQ